MSDKTGIEWTDATWNPVRGCSRVSEGCRNCYAERVAARFSGPGKPYEGFAKVTAPRDLLDRVGGRRNGWTGEVRLINKHLADPLRWKKPRRIFVNSMSDLFHERLTNEQIAAVFGVMAAAPQHTFQCLTKRSKRMREWFAWIKERGDRWAPRRCGDAAEVAGAPVYRVGPNGRSPWNDSRCMWPLPNVWLGVSVENQAAADERIPDLLSTPAAVRFLSCEPQLGEVDLRHVQHDRMFEVDALTGDHGVRRPLAGRGPGIDWVIAGCESGPGARPCDVAWLRSLRDQCADAETAFFLKQAREVDGQMTAVPPPTPLEDQPGYSPRVGPFIPTIGFGPGSKRKAGGVIGAPYLDGKQHLAFPTSP